jgi:hypothetical protein
VIPVLCLVLIGALVGGVIVSYTSQPELSFDPIQAEDARRIMRTAWRVPAGTREQQRPVVKRTPLLPSRSPKKKKGTAAARTAKKRKQHKIPAIILAHRRPGG